MSQGDSLSLVTGQWYCPPGDTARPYTVADYVASPPIYGHVVYRVIVFNEGDRCISKTNVACPDPSIESLRGVRI